MCSAARLPFGPQHLSGSPGSGTRARPCGPTWTVPESQHGLCVAHGLAGWDTGHLQDAASGRSSPPLCHKMVQRAGYSWHPLKVSLAHRIAPMCILGLVVRMSPVLHVLDVCAQESGEQGRFSIWRTPDSGWEERGRNCSCGGHGALRSSESF